MMIELVVATKNKKKLQELKTLLRDVKVKVVSLAQLPRSPRIVENGRTFADNAIKKATVIARFSGKLTLGEDSGLCVDALGGEPGVYSSRYAGKNKSDSANNRKLLKELEGRKAKERKAQYVCAVALADNSGLIGLTEGRCDGVIAFREQGHHGFGYDPLFFIPRYAKTFGQLSISIKHAMSHRYRALVKAKKLITRYLNSK